MTSNAYVTDENGLHECDMCGFTTPHETRIQRHMIKSHGHAAYPPPPIRAEKWEAAEDARAERGEEPELIIYEFVMEEDDASDNAD